MAPDPSPTESSARADEALARAHLRLSRLNEIGKLLTRFESVDRTIPAVISIMARTLRLQSTIFILENEPPYPPLVTQCAGRGRERLQAARDHLRLTYAYLGGRGGIAEELAGQPVPQEEAAPRRIDQLPAQNRFIVLPLAVTGRPIFGALQVEAGQPLEEQDLVFANAAVNQMAIALDRLSASEAVQAAIQQRRAAADAHNQTLERLVTERTAVAETRTRELARSNAELLQLAQVTAHDLKEPLRAVLVCAQLLTQASAGALDEECTRMVSRIEAGARRMSALIDALLAYAQLGRSARANAPVDCNSVLDDSLGNLSAAIADCGAQVTRGRLPVVPGNRELLTQLFQNLLENALKFRGPRSPEISVSAELYKGQWVFEFRDNGIGIPTKQAKRVFEIFRRLHSQADYPGTGIGLAICKKVVEAHHGHIWLLRTPGGGATFRFVLERPVADQEEPPDLP